MESKTQCCTSDCCSEDHSNDKTVVTQAVKSQYGAVAASQLSNAHAGVRAVAEAFGYSTEELSSIPQAANMGLSCGNPTAIASIRDGETVVDLGSGGGLDVFLASQKVGVSGKAIGIDMTPEMIDRAKRSATEGGYANVEFHLATIDRTPLADNSADCVISNCVINLAPDKSAVFREIYRILKPDGRLAASDIALKKPLPDALKSNISAYVGCIAGAELIEDYVQQLRDAGFREVMVQDSKTDLNAYAKLENQSGCCSPAMSEGVSVTSRTVSSLAIAKSSCGCGSNTNTEREEGATLHTNLSDLLKRYDVNDYAASVKVFAIK